VQKLIAQGRLPGVRVGRSLLVDSVEVERFRQEEAS
jgi:excisionase family DNA binding protein